MSMDFNQFDWLFALDEDHLLPPGTAMRITDDSESRITDDGDERITDEE